MGPPYRFHALPNGADFTAEPRRLFSLLAASVPSTTATTLAIRDPASAKGLSTTFLKDVSNAEGKLERRIRSDSTNP